MKQLIKRLFLNEKFILAVIFINAALIYAQVAGYENKAVIFLDALCTVIFIVEMIIKHLEYGVHGYWSDGWNKLDGTLVIISIPSLITVFFPNVEYGASVLLILRVLRVLRFFRVMHFFPNFSKIVGGFKIAMQQSYGVLLSFLIIIVIFGLLNCSLFSEADPNHFGSPLRSIYSVFQICTVEGWYEIPDTLAEYYGNYSILPHLIRLYFTSLLIMGGIIGMSFINSIFVDAMVADNNDVVEHKIDKLNDKIDLLQKEIERLLAEK